ncbi:MAG TPA: hypothetical protein VMC43_03385 [Candidatus Paceibacterota bacterium]|nr:hypothetical protein [Candidatus Paceibacterota bacterium]
MPNVEICGYDDIAAEQLRRDVESVIQELGLQDDTVTSVVRMDVRSCDGKKRAMPYLRVCGTSRGEVDAIISAFGRFEIHEDVELLVLDGFISSKEMAGKTATD